MLTIMKPLITGYVCCVEALYRTNGQILLIPPVTFSGVGRGQRLWVYDLTGINQRTWTLYSV